MNNNFISIAALTILSGTTAMAQYNPTAKTTATAQRLIGKVDYQNDRTGIYSLSDSTVFGWSGTFGSVQYIDSQLFNPIVSTAKYNDYQQWRGSTSGLLNSQKARRTYDADGNNIEEYIFVWDKTTSSWDTASISRNNYVSGKIQMDATDAKSGAGWSYDRKSYAYAGDTIKIMYEARKTPTSAWQSITRTTEIYSGANLVERIVEDTVSGGTWRNQTRFRYTYSGALKTGVETFMWIPSAWVPNYKNIYTYSGSHLSIDSSKHWNSSAAKWADISAVKYNYTGADMTEYISETTDGTGVFKYGGKGTFTYSAGNPIEVVYTQRNTPTDPWITTNRVLFQYNTSNNLISEERQTWNSGVWEPGVSDKQKVFYYYEDYSTTGIPGIISGVSNASVYPNPATAPHVYVDYFTERADVTEVVLSNTLGQVVYRSTEGGSIGDHSVQVPVSALAPGVYFVSIYSGSQLCQTMKLLK